MPDAVLDRMSVDDRERVWRGILARSGEESFTFVAAGSEGQVEGFCSASAASRDEDAGAGTAEVAATYVDPERWRRGVGRALLQGVWAELLNRGSREATLWVFAANDRARSFYAAFGFEPDGATSTHESSGQQLVRMSAALGG